MQRPLWLESHGSLPLGAMDAQALGERGHFEGGCGEDHKPQPSGGDEDNDEVDLVMVPHASYVVLCDRPDGLQSVVHLGTHEHLLLPADAGRFSLLFDESGFGVLVADDAGRNLVVEDIFKRAMYQREGDGALFVHEAGVERIWSLTDKRRQYRSARVVWSYGVGHQACLQAFALVWHRQGFSLAWSLVALYKLVGLTCYKNQPSKWFYESQCAWSQHFGFLGFSEGLMKSVHGEASDDGGSSDVPFLPTPCATTGAFVALLVRFLHHSPQKGGLRQDLRAHVRSLLQGLIVSLASKRGASNFELPVHVTQTWLYRWPPSESTPADFKLQVDTAGKIDLSPLLTAASPLPRRSPRLVRKWANILQDLAPECETVDLLVTLSAAPPSSGALSFFVQVLSQVAVCLEKSLGAECSSPGPLPPKGLGIKADEASDMIRTDRDIDMVLHRHLQSAIACLSDTQHVSVACDKAWIKGLNLMNGVLVTPANLCVMCPPQVGGRWGCHSGTHRALVEREGKSGIVLVYIPCLGV